MVTIAKLLSLTLYVGLALSAVLSFSGSSPYFRGTAYVLWRTRQRLCLPHFDVGRLHRPKLSGIAEVKYWTFTRPMADSDISSSSNQEIEPKKTKLKRLPNSSVEITLRATPKQTQVAYDRVTTDFSKQITIKGFRKGSKIPTKLLENAIAAKGEKNTNIIREEAVRHLLGQMVEPAVKQEHKLQPIGQPVLTVKVEELAKSFVPGEECEMIVRCDVWPEVKWKEKQHVDEGEGKGPVYYGLKGKYKRKPFNQVRYEAAINDLKDRYASLDPMKLDESLNWGDSCVVNMVGWLANNDGSRGERLPDAASGDNVEIVLGLGRYMEGLSEGLIGATVGEVRTVTVTFPENLRDKSLAGKNAIFELTVSASSHRVLPDLDDEFASNIRSGMKIDELQEELRKAIDEEESKEFVDERNKALGSALADIVDVDVPETVVVQQAKEKYAAMMSDMRGSGMSDDELKQMITVENFEKFKEIYASDIVKDFRISIATDEIAKLENIEVPSYQVDEQMEAMKNKAQKESEEFDETLVRSKVEGTLQRRMVFDMLADHADLDVEYVEEVQFDEDLMQKLAEDSLAREKAAADDIASTPDVQL